MSNGRIGFDLIFVQTEPLFALSQPCTDQCQTDEVKFFRLYDFRATRYGGQVNKIPQQHKMCRLNDTVIITPKAPLVWHSPLCRSSVECRWSSPHQRGSSNASNDAAAF